MNRTTNIVSSIIELVFLMYLFIFNFILIFYSFDSFSLYTLVACIIVLIVLNILDLLRPKSTKRLAMAIFIAAIGMVILSMFYEFEYASDFNGWFSMVNALRFRDLWPCWLELLSPIFIIILSIIKLKAPAKIPSVSINPSQTDIVNKLVEYKELLDMGAITEEEFNAKKTQLLGL